MPIVSKTLPSFRWKLCLTLAVVALGDLLFYQWQLYGGHIGFLALALIGCVLVSQSARLHDVRVWIALAFAGLFAVALVIDPGPLALLLFWTAISMAVLLAASAGYDDGWLWFQRLALHGLWSSVSPMVDFAAVVRSGRRRRLGRPRLRFSALLSLLALPVVGSLVIIWLFAEANPIIADFLARINLPQLRLDGLRLQLWTVLGFAAWSLLRPRFRRPLLGTFDGSGDLPLPGVSVASVRLSLILFNLLFAVQNLLDIAYLWGVIPLPKGVTLAGYAHRGAYPLIVTALLAAAFVLITLRPGSTTASARGIRALVVMWIGQNIFLVASSILRTLDYIDVYLLTTLRIAALAWMGLVALGLALICWRMLRGKSAAWLINANLLAAGLLLNIFCFVDSGAIAARWNVRHAREVGGHAVPLDLCYLSGLGDAALLPLMELEARPLQPAFRGRVQAVRERVLERLAWDQGQGGWTLRGTWRLRAAWELGNRPLPVMPLGDADRKCDGRVIPPARPPTAPELTGPVAR